MNKINITPHILIICPTYKESFILRRALIELNIDWGNPHRNKLYTKQGLKHWNNKWNTYRDQTVYCIEFSGLQFCNKCFFFNEECDFYKDYATYTVDDFIKKYIMPYGKT